MKINKCLFLLLVISFSYSQIDYSINYEVKLSMDEDDFENNSVNNFENYFDINLYYKDLYFYSLLKYTNPPLIGSTTNNLKDIFNIFYMDYSNNDLSLTFGHIYQMYGAGLSMHTFNDRNIDYNNGVFGLDLSYHINDYWNIFGIIGVNEFKSRTKLDLIEPDIQIDNTLALGGFSYNYDWFDITYLVSVNQQNINSESIIAMETFANFYGNYLEDRFDDIIPEDYEMLNYENNLSFNFFLGDMEVSFEKSWVYYNKIMDERVFGSRFYFSSYLNFYDYNILYEYKDYDTPYLYSVFSNPPTLFREATSPLISRHVHSVDFSNERGHYISINKSFSDQINLVSSISFAYKNAYDDNLDKINFSKIINNIIKFKNLSDFNQVSPYRQLYLEFNGWSKNSKVFYKVGFDNYLEYFNLNGPVIDTPDKIIKALTLPTQFSFKLDKGNSLSVYVELQKLRQYITGEGIFHSMYFSPSYNHYGKWILSLFADLEKDHKT